MVSLFNSLTSIGQNRNRHACLSADRPEKAVLFLPKDSFCPVSDFEITDLPTAGRYFYP
jgi:hypothetical protein